MLFIFCFRTQITKTLYTVLNINTIPFSTKVALTATLEIANFGISRGVTHALYFLTNE